MHRTEELDGIRGIAILMVLVWHYIGAQIIPSDTSTALIKIATGITWSGVDLFFVLSGFLLGGILLKNRASVHYFKTFYIRRACRILPLYFLFMLTFLITHEFFFAAGNMGYSWLYGNSMPTWSYATFTQNIYMAIKGTTGAHYMGITWSLAAEEQFYLLLPIVIWYLRGRFLVITLISLIITAPLLRGYVFSLGVDAYLLSITRLDSLMTGALLAWCLQNPVITAYIRDKQPLFYLSFTVFLLGYALLSGKPDLFGTFNHTWLAIMYALLILIVVSYKNSVAAVICRNKPLGLLGLISYSVYLFHQPLNGYMHILFRSSFPQLYNVQTMLINLASVVIVIALSALSYRYIEQPVIRLGRNVNY